MLAESDGAKGRGNEQFKLGKYLWAADHYTEAIEISEPGRGTPDIRAARAIYFSNRAQARIKMARAATAATACACAVATHSARLSQELFEQAAGDCTAALKLSPNNVKTLLRRSKAWEGQDKLIEAVDDMKKVVELSPCVQAALVAALGVGQIPLPESARVVWVAGWQRTGRSWRSWRWHRRSSSRGRRRR